jgi:CBS domain containing-hemolysin-like protein
MEPPGTLLLDVIIIALSILAIAVLSSSESSFIAVNKIRIRSLIDKGDRRARAVQKVLDEHDRLFSAVILSGNLFTVLATSLGTALALRFLGPEIGIVVATVVLTFLTVVFGELAPKTFAVTHSEKVSLFLARPLALYIRLISPLIWIFKSTSNLILRLFGVKEKPLSPYVTEEEIKTMINIGEEEGTIEEDEKEMLHRIFEFGDTEVSEVMIPRTEMVAIPENATVTDAMKLVSDKGYSRYPVIKDNMDNITGILYIKDLLITMSQTSIENLSISNFMRVPFYIPENKMVTELLDDMQKRKFHIAVVIDEYGGTAGLITLEDIMEVIVGGLQDEFEAIEAEKDVEVIDERTFVVTGQTPIDEINELVGVELANEDFNTIGGLVFGLFGRLPKVGEQVRTYNLRFLVMDMEEKKLSKIKITKL